MKKIGSVFGLLVLMASCQKEVITPRTLPAEGSADKLELTGNTPASTNSLSVGATTNTGNTTGSGSAGISSTDPITVVVDDNGGITDPNHDPSGNNKDRRKR